MTNAQSNRFRTIDGLRGIAALGVVFYHLSIPIQSELMELAPGVTQFVFRNGNLGVFLFFVISGFVISLSVGNNRVSVGYAGNFILRRSIRLDPTYWAAIAFALLLVLAKNVVLDQSQPLPSGTTVLAHMVYLQEILSVEPIISVVYWTLCLELQFYLYFIFTAWLSQRFCNGMRAYIVQISLAILTGLLSLLTEFGFLEMPIPGLFVSTWHYFLLGVLVSNVVRGLPYAVTILAVWLAVEVSFQFFGTVTLFPLTGVLFCVLILVLYQSNKLDTYLCQPIMQYLGRLSYTLYLVHPDVGWKAIEFVKMSMGGVISPWQSLGLLMFGIAVSIVVAHAFHVLFERPSLRLCNKLKRPAAEFHKSEGTDNSYAR